MNYFRNFVILLFFLVFQIINATAADFIGVLGFAIGDIENQRGQKLVNGSKIYFGDTVKVKKKSNAQVLLLDETILTVGEDSEVKIDEFIYDPQSKSGKIVSLSI